ncbi:DUF2510 domain-containing protein [Streptomyces sp. NBC_01387]|uniref:DUF2510 domain-containing protein n=1 Tax=unclassified Streptomyces TaxID=2593676 RepID=UPI0020256689|nr:MULTISPECIES: DUF2510 domain-containing protein [unclassified Streptomyces]MCX4553683.1 DUF2510 domain-containing protein [Streptomyces sp. NBC_01500]WSC18611.1 DUF2510 domain-containing protein [Streptomyces sp. NBC_01766]WSV52645.1 DUF2510 domain-containing protein [Streptomyces sp. NBC_01014]
MTQTSPPGWHRDPGYTGIGPAQERWWDGSQWTDLLRVPPTAVRRRRVRIGAAVTAGVVVLAAVGGGIYLLTDGSGHGSGNVATAPSTAPSKAPGRPGVPGGTGGGDGSGGGSSDGGGNQDPQQQTPPTEDGYATDAASGISIPVPDGWTGQSGTVGAGVTIGKYTCASGTDSKGAPAECVRGGVFSAPAVALKLSATTAKGAAEKDISTNAKESYGDSSSGITSHQQLESQAVTVAGQQGYLVRWKVVTKKGDDGYVQSLAFPSPQAKNMLIVVRSGFDINAKAPELSVMDEITKGIKAASTSGSGSGEGA